MTVVLLTILNLIDLVPPVTASDMSGLFLHSGNQYKSQNLFSNSHFLLALLLNSSKNYLVY